MNKSMRSFQVSVLTAALCLLAAAPTPAQELPTVQKDSVMVKLHTDTTMRNGQRREEWGRSWVPGIGFSLNGPIPSGSQLYVEFSLPTNKHWIQIDCPTQEIKADAWWKTGCGYEYGLDNDAFTSKNVNVTGLVDFAIRMRNELLGSDATLFTGKVKVIKALPLPQNPTYYEYYADEDWRIPIGYVYPGTKRLEGRDDFLHVGFWYRGNPPDIEAHLFYKGKDIAKYTTAGNSASDWEPNKYMWGYEDCSFTGVYTEPLEDGRGYDPKFEVRKNPGEYEVKVLIVNHLARSIKFTVNADGSFDNGIASANKLGRDVTIVPVQVIGNQTANWDRTAWKTGAFYANPLTGFTAGP